MRRSAKPSERLVQRFVFIRSGYLDDYKIQKILFDFFLVIIFAAVAIVLHAIMPSPGATMDTSEFDSFLVKKFGFPAVASGYFVVLFLHILFTIKVFAVKSDIGKWKTGCCFGMAFALLYMGGMQEVMVSASPLTEYGLDFVLYELFLGLGGAVPAFLLCIFLCIFHCAPSPGVQGRMIFCKENIIRMMSIAGIFFAWRMTGYVTGIVDNEMWIYPVPVVIWTFVFGIIIGVGHCLINYSAKNNIQRTIIRLFLTVGVNWIWFNCYIGLIAAHTFGFMVLRAGADVIDIMVGGLVAELIIQKQKRHCEGSNHQ